MYYYTSKIQGIYKYYNCYSNSSENYGHCLNTKPSVNYLSPKERLSKLPGEYFDENQQCEFVFGNGSKICSYMVSYIYVIQYGH